MAKNDPKKITVVAANEVVWYIDGNGVCEQVLSFDKAWHLMLDKAAEGYFPVKSRFVGFVRKPDAE